jgi:hypothetical protein
MRATSILMDGADFNAIFDYRITLHESYQLSKILNIEI